MASDAEVATWDTAAKVACFKAAAPAEKIEARFLDDETCRRFLRARQGDVSKAVHMLAKHQEWRRETTPHWPERTFALSEVEADLKSGKAYVRGRTKDGQPAGWIRAALHDAKADREALNKFVILMLDEVVARMGTKETPAAQFTFVLDFKDFGWSNYDVNVLLYILKMLSHNYPERLGRCLILNEGWLFWALWKCVTPFIDARTAKKIKFLGSGYREQLLEVFDDSQIPPHLGGKDAYVYDPKDVTKTPPDYKTVAATQAAAAAAGGAGGGATGGAGAKA